MKTAAKIATGVSAVTIVGLLALAAPAVTALTSAAPTPVNTTATPAPSPTPEGLTELPEWALASTPWLIYPEGFECVGTEGCPNDYRASFGEPGDVLPAGVEYYDPAKHNHDPTTGAGMVFPTEQEPAYASCATFPGLTPATYVEDTVNGLEPTLLVDSGPAPGATGETATNDEGQPLAYIAAEGDNFRAIAARFCVGTNPEYLEWLNSIRRNSSYSSYTSPPATVNPGDTINLSPWTVATVGDEAGVVHSFTPPFPLPEQY